MTYKYTDCCSTLQSEEPDLSPTFWGTSRPYLTGTLSTLQLSPSLWVCALFLFIIYFVSKGEHVVSGTWSIMKEIWGESYCMLYICVNTNGCVFFFFVFLDLHECCLARLGHPHVPLPGYPAPVLKLPHCQVQKKKTQKNYLTRSESMCKINKSCKKRLT